MKAITQTVILMSTYNGEHYIGPQLDSILCQSFDGFTIYIRDDGSTDNTLNIINRYQHQYPNKIIVISDNLGNLGAKRSFLNLMKTIEADYYLFADQDDVWFPHKVKNTIEKLQTLENKAQDTPCCVFTNAIVVDDNLHIISASLWEYTYTNPLDAFDVYKMIVNTNPAYGCTIGFNKAALVECMKRSSFVTKIGAYHDELVVCTTSLTGKIGIIEDPQMSYRRHQFNVTNAHSEKNQSGIVKIILQKPLDVFHLLFNKYRKLKSLGIRPSFIKMIYYVIKRITSR